MFKISRLGTRHKVEERNTSGVDINLAKTRRGHPYIELVDVVLDSTNVESIAQIDMQIYKKGSQSRRLNI